MIITPKIRGFICTTAHPIGCFKMVEAQINYMRTQKPVVGPKRVLVIGASTGYGLATRIAATYGTTGETIGVFFEKPADEKRTASPGWYNSAAFEQIAHRDQHYAKSINGDAFSYDTKQKTAALIRQDLQQIDLVIYSIASPRRIHPQNNTVYSSVLKPIGDAFTGKSMDAFRGEIIDVTIPPATPEEITNTINVMGGEDWALWIQFLKQEKLLAERAITIAYSYVGPELTHPIYKNGTIGKAKEHLQQTADELHLMLKPLQGAALIAMNKAVVTQASAAIPVVPLYLAVLFKIMKAKGTHEGCIEQMHRLFHDYLSDATRHALFQTNNNHLNAIPLDRFELDPETQQEVAKVWPALNTQTLERLTDLEGYKQDFYRLFGFEVPGVDYNASVNSIVAIPSLET